ncbi:aminopeptidase [Polaribacter sp. MSW13]|uniref:Aminopeptidase n=1 Tax=Polaribacter marinus TaxID=2916838 RepID=A0A9X1VLF3_9FLAO|nr:aminopeptidase [Polaribacter marinus]MCI2227662.1 aminopeptidase [Polaribacter marinus]
MKKSIYISILLSFLSISLFSQNNKITIKSTLNPKTNELLIQQEIIFHNNADTTLTEIFLHNWANSFKDRKTPLSKRFIEDFNKTMYFAKEEDLGHTTIKNISVNFENANYQELTNQADIIQIDLEKPLIIGDSIKISATYSVKIPSSKFTGYGKTDRGYKLRFWYLTPAVYKNGWQLMSNLNLDDLYEEATDFNIEIDLPKDYILESNLYQYKTAKENHTNYYLVGINKTNITLDINNKKQLKTLKTKNITIYTDIDNYDFDYKLTTSILNRELLFIEKYLGKYPHKEIFIDKAVFNKNPVFGLNQLPDFIRPFSDVFKYDISMFKSITKNYIESTLLLNQRKDYWFLDGLQNYLMIEYVAEYYPEIKLLGKASDSWLLKRYNISKLNFNDKYPFVYQFGSRKFLDQALITSSDSLSNFNRKIVSKYKAGLGFRYLKEYLGKNTLNQSIKEFYQKHQLKTTTSVEFKEVLTKKTNKNVSWFFNDFINTNKKIDYTIDKVTTTKDSIKVTIRNKRNITSPVLLYGLNDKKINYKKWITNVSDTTTVTIPKGDSNKVALNYENIYPELNTLDNWKSLENKIFNKPLKFSLIKDVQDPYYTQLFYQPNVQYNFYNGLILGVKIHNKPLIKRNLEFKIDPSYATKSKSILGSVSVLYNQYFEKGKIYKMMYGLSATTLDYAPNLSYKSFIPFVNLSLKRKSLREATSEDLTAQLVYIDKDVAPGNIKTPQDNYHVFSLSYNYRKPDIIKEVWYKFNVEFSKQFSKAAVDLRFRSLTTSDTQLDFRFFAGAFLKNNSTGNYFSFGLDRSNDYLFQLNYFGRSEDSGLFSQQYIINEGGFKSVLATRYANQYMFSFNSSIGMWKWVELYNDVAFLKNKKSPIFFGYENGIRLNFIHNIFEIYLPFYSNNGWEISQEAYPQKIRFTLTTDFNSIYDFFKRGFL